MILKTPVETPKKLEKPSGFLIYSEKIVVEVINNTGAITDPQINPVSFLIKIELHMYLIF